MIPQGPEGPAFLVTQNFMAIMAYNLSHSYALAVAHLGDRIQGGVAFNGNWPDTGFGLTFPQRVAIQKLLTSHGFDTGGSDGRFGARTYEAVLGFQKKAGLPLDGKPSAKLLEQLRAAG
jgi:membrane-bound lytic murein transglycosylase B